MELFRRKRRLKAAENELTDQLWGKIRFWLSRHEMYLANYLNRKTRGLSFRCWLIMLTGFCLIVGSYLGYLLLGIFN